MKITLGELKRIIKEALEEEAGFPGRGFGGGRLDPEDEERLAYQGFLDIHEEELGELEEDENTNQ